MGKVDGMPAKPETMPRDYPWMLSFDENLRLSGWDSPYKARDFAVAANRRDISDWATIFSILANNPIARTRLQRLRKRHYSFVFLDVGRWGGSEENKHGMQRNFGVIWGKWVVLCNYLGFNFNYPDYIDRDKKGSMLDEFLRSLCTTKSAVRVIKKLYCHELKKPDWSKIQVLLPDLHLPVVTGRPREEVPGRFVAEFSASAMKGPELRDLSLDGWYKYYQLGDIFNGGEKDLCDFLILLATNPVAKGEHLHLIQLGDMYELWVGIKPYFENRPETTSKFPLVVNTEGRKTIRALIGRTHNENKAVFDAFKYVNDSGHAVTYLYGNHDNYLAKPICPEGAGVPGRHKEYRQDGLFCEHGHAGDSSNADHACGKTLKGYDITRQVFYHPVVRSFDPKRRAIWTCNAALSWIANPDFQVYAMAHTHSPFLTRVKLYLRRTKKAKKLDEAFRDHGIPRL
jgi:hypothetical protein